MNSRLTFITFLFLFIGVFIFGCAAGLNMTPYLHLSSDSIDFGNTAINSTRITELVIENHDSETLKMRSFNIINYSANANNNEYKIVEILDPQSNEITDFYNVKVPKYSYITVRISFEPTILEKIDAIFIFDHNDGKLDAPIQIPITGIGVESVLKSKPEIIDFSTSIIGLTKKIDSQIINISNNEIKIVHFDLDPATSIFAIESVTNSLSEALTMNTPFTVASGDFVNVKISYEPVLPEDSNIDLIISYTDNDVLSQVSIPITGTGVRNNTPVIEYIDLDPVHIGEKSIVKAKLTDPDGKDDIDSILCSLQLHSLSIIALNDSGLFDDDVADDDIYTGSVVIPNTYMLYGSHDLTVTVFDKSNAEASELAFQLIYTGDLIEVGQGKPFTTIKPAVNASVDGDCVLIYDGDYNSNNNATEENRDVDFNGKEIIVTTKNGAEKTLMKIDGAPGIFHRGFVCTSNETLNTIIEGLTIYGGFMRHSYGGGAIVCVDSALTILNCVIEENIGTCDSSGYAYGGGISAINSRLVVKKCKYLNNNAFV